MEVLSELTNNVLVVTLNRPEAGNALNGALSEGLSNALTEAAENGITIDVANGHADITGSVPCGYVYVDGQSVGEITESSLKDRRILGDEGFISVVVVIDSQSGKIVAGPDIHARGFTEDQSLFDDVKGDKIEISEDVYKDTNVDKWAYDLPSLQGSKILIDKLIKHPINDRELLEKRQKSIINYDIDIEILKEYEGDILWIYKISEEINENNSIEILFPSTFIINYINYIETLLDLYHMYKIFFIPITSVLYPISTFMAPYIYLNKYLKMNISFASYIEIIIQILKMMCTSTPTTSQPALTSAALSA